MQKLRKNINLLLRDWNLATHERKKGVNPCCNQIYAVRGDLCILYAVRSLSASGQCPSPVV